jgi:hypothetical protein
VELTLDLQLGRDAFLMENPLKLLMADRRAEFDGVVFNHTDKELKYKSVPLARATIAGSESVLQSWLFHNRPAAV